MTGTMRNAPLSGRDAPMDAELQNWYALHVRSRHEFAATSELGRKGVEVFMPSVSRQSRWKDRTRIVAFPLFPGYVFVRIVRAAEEFLKVIKTRGAVHFICLTPGHPTPVDRSEIDALRTMLQSGASVDVYPGLTPGTRVQVVRGPLMGAQGVLARRENGHEFCVNMELLGRSVGLRISAGDIERL